MKPALVQILSVVSLVAFFTPLVIVLFKKLGRDAFFMLFALYWAMSGIIALTDFLPVSSAVRRTIGAVYNMMDIPIVLYVLYFTSNFLPIKKFTAAVLVSYVILELISVFIKGVNYEALKYTLGTGLGLVLTVVAWEIVRYLQKMEHNNRQNAKVLIYTALLFEYASFIVVYIFDYFTDDSFRNTVEKDIYLIYYISTLIGISIASWGYLVFQKYTREEPLKNEVGINII